MYIKSIIILVMSFLILISCSEINNTNVKKTIPIINSENKLLIDMGKGKKGGTVAFKINLAEGFKTKANVAGWDSLYASITSYKIALVTTTGGSSLTTAPANNSSDVISITTSAITGTKTAPTTQIFLTNVPAGTYWIAVAAYDAQGRNVTQSTSNSGTISVASGDTFAVSTGGGNGDASPNNGRVTVASDFSVPSSAVTIPLTLVDSFGANLQATVTITDGTTNVKSDINLIRFYLVNSNSTSNLVDTNIIKGPFDLSTGSNFTSLKAGTATTLTFASVPEGTYYIAGAAYSSSSTVDSSTNITSLTANTFSNISITSNPTPVGNMGTFSVSTSGGDSGTTGRVVVSSAYGISTNSPVVLPLKLFN